MRRMRRTKRILALLGLFALFLLAVHCYTERLGTQFIMIVNNLYTSMTVLEDIHALPVDKRLFQSIVEQEFPSTPSNEFRIPHIIHQIYTDENVPHILAPMIGSFVSNNPSWQYMFWTYSTGNTLITRTHPYLLDAYNNFTSNNGVKRVDLLRWVILYEFGGLYADMDVVCLRPLDIATKRYACILPVEPFEHAAMYNTPYFMSNAILLCRPKHPFIKFVLRNLVGARDKGNPVTVTGPGFINKMFRTYNNINIWDKYLLKTDLSSNSPTFYKGELEEIHNDAVYVPNSQYFIDSLSPTVLKKLDKMCFNNSQTFLPELQKRACLEYTSRQKIRRNQKFTFTVHHWFHLWTYPPACLERLETVPIRYIVPSRINYL